MKKQNPLPLLLAFALLLLAAIPAQATIVINANEVGGDVVFVLNGSVNLDSLVYDSTTTATGGLAPAISSSGRLIQMLPFGGLTYDTYTVSEISGPLSFGSGGLKWFTSLSGDPFLFHGTAFIFNTGYAGTALHTTMTMDNATFSTLGMSPGTYVWTWSSGGASDNLILNIGPVPNAAPTANAGLDQSIHAGTTVNLDGSLSFDDNTASTALQYSWSFTQQPAGSSATLSNANTATPSFVADLDGSYVVQLIVTDEEGLASAPDEVLISSINQAPTAFATASTTLPMVGAVVTLDGSTSSDPDGDPLAYSWTVTSAPDGSVAAIFDADASTATFTPDVLGEYEITLTVSDFLGAGTPASVTLVAGDAAQFAQEQIIAAAAIVAGLPQSQITRPGNRKDFEALLRRSVNYLRDGDVPSAIHELTKAIGRTDGCALRGVPDGSGPGFDWISDCAGQEPVYDLLTAALNALQP
jgi:K319L-like, PKD domain